MPTARARFHASQPVRPPFGVEPGVRDGTAGVPPEGPEEGGEADDNQIERPEETRLAAVAGLVAEQAVIGWFPEIDEVAEGDAAVHVGAADKMNVPRNVLKIGMPFFSFQEPAEDQPDQILGKLPDLQQDGGQEVHITRTR